MKGLVVVPAFNEEAVIQDVLKNIPKVINSHSLTVVVINDGSTDNTLKVVTKCKAKVVSHPINRGLGAALGTGFEYARLKKFDFLITLDGDGQHDPKEISKIINPIIKKQADFVIGTRFLQKGMPITRRVLTFFATLATFIFTGLWTTDSQSGYRAFSKRAIKDIFIEVDRMEVATNFFEQARTKKLVVKEVPIKPIYTQYSLAKGQNIFNSANIIGKLTLKKLVG